MTQDNNMKGVENYLPRNVHIFKYNFRKIDQKNILKTQLKARMLKKRSFFLRRNLRHVRSTYTIPSTNFIFTFKIIITTI